MKTKYKAKVTIRCTGHRSCQGYKPTGVMVSACIFEDPTYRKCMNSDARKEALKDILEGALHLRKDGKR